MPSSVWMPKDGVDVKMNKYSELRNDVYYGNIQVVDSGLALLTWGNASAVDERREVMAIKPSGVVRCELSPDAIVLVSLHSGQVIHGDYRPSSDTATHLELYRSFPGVNAVVHTHSRFAVVFAQAGRDVPILGTTHADHFRDRIPCTRQMTPEEIESDYEKNTGKLMVEHFRNEGIQPSDVPAALVRNHGPFVWGETVASALENAIALEEVACIAWHNLILDVMLESAPSTLTEKHFLRKHGAGRYYGQ